MKHFQNYSLVNILVKTFINYTLYQFNLNSLIESFIQCCNDQFFLSHFQKQLFSSKASGDDTYKGIACFLFINLKQ